MSWQGGIPPGHGWPPSHHGQPPNMMGMDQNGYPGYPPFSQQNGDNWAQHHPGFPGGPENGAHYPMTSQPGFPGQPPTGHPGYPGMAGPNPYGMGGPGFPGGPGQPYGHPGFPSVSMPSQPGQNSMAQMGYPPMPSASFPGPNPSNFTPTSQQPQRPRPSSTNVTSVYKQSMATPTPSHPHPPGVPPNPMFSQASGPRTAFPGAPIPQSTRPQAPQVQAELRAPSPAAPVGSSPMPDFSFNNRGPPGPAAYSRAPVPNQMNGAPTVSTLPQKPQESSYHSLSSGPVAPSGAIGHLQPHTLTQPPQPGGFSAQLQSPPPSVVNPPLPQQPTPKVPPQQQLATAPQIAPPTLHQQPKNLQAPHAQQQHVQKPPFPEPVQDLLPTKDHQPPSTTPTQELAAPSSAVQEPATTAQAEPLPLPEPVEHNTPMPSSPPKPPQLQPKPVSPHEKPEKTAFECGPPKLTPPKLAPSSIASNEPVEEQQNNAANIPEFSDSEEDTDKTNDVDDIAAKFSSDEDENEKKENLDPNLNDKTPSQNGVQDEQSPVKSKVENSDEDEQEQEETQKKRLLLEAQLKENSSRDSSKMEIDESESTEEAQSESNGVVEDFPAAEPSQEAESAENPKKRKRSKKEKKSEARGITREAAAAAAAALVSDADVDPYGNYRISDSNSNSNDVANDEDFEIDDHRAASPERMQQKKNTGRRGKPKVPATIINATKKKKKYDFDDEDEGKSKSKKKRRKIESTEEEFISPEDLIEKRRSGRSSRGAPKNYDDNAVPNFSDGDADSDDDEPARKRGRKKKESVDTSEDGVQEPVAEIAEEPLIVDKILSHRIVKRKKSSEGSEDESAAEGKTDETKTDAEKKTEEEAEEEEEEEFFIKWKGYSYIHGVWLFKDEIFDPRFDQKMRRYFSKLGSTNAPDPDNEDLFNPDFVVVDRVLDVVEGHDESGKETRHFLVKWCGLAYDECTWELEADVDQVKIECFRKFSKRKPYKRLSDRPPISQWRKLEHPQRFKNGCELREYQVEGVSWLLFNWYQKRNCILADEMGLGKTIQSITFIQKIYETSHKGPFLIVVPLSTVGNWIREFETWTDLNAIVYHGSAQSRQMIHQYELYQRDKKGYPKRGDFRFDALITTYEMIVADIPEIRNVNWQLMIIDEAHRLKNTKSKLAENLKNMHIEHKVLLTGTPLQNNIEELYALLNFMNPTDFYDIGYFMREYGILTNKEHVEKMQKVLKPIMLRRLKEDVEKSLAPKEETIIEVELTNIQKKYYRAILERNFDFLSKGASTGNVPSLMNTMMELRKCCNHPFLIKGAEDKILDEYRAKGEVADPLTSIVQASGKMVLIHKLLPKLKAGGHKVLIFSQMIRVLDILEDYLYQMSMGFERLDGRIRGNDRQAAIDRFCKPDSDRFVFLLCTRAGGLGINLTAADTVIIFDSDWNPQNDLQAQARCHRIGQKKEVKIYRLLTSKTYEREMFDRASLKLGLDRAVLQSMSGTSGKDAGGPMSSLSKKEVEDLLKKGAYGALMDDDDAAEKFCEEDIDQILAKRATTIKHDGGVKGSTFSKATFAGAADNRMDIDINDPDFWEKWARKADLDLDALTSNKLIIEQPRVRKQTQRYNPEFDETAHIEGMEGSDSDSDGAPGKKRRNVGWGRKESFKLQKGLLMFGWGRWQDISEHCQLSKSFPEKEVEEVARAVLSLAASCYNGDDKVKQFIWELITPPEFAHELHLHSALPQRQPTKKSKRGRDSESPPPLDEGREWVIQLDGLLVDDQFRKHVVTHANKLLGRVRVLSYLRTEILADWLDHIKDNVPSTEYELDVPNIEGDPPVPWWDEEADKSLLVGIFKHGYDRYSLIRNDPSLVFVKKVGPADDKALMADLMEGESKPVNTNSAEARNPADKEYKPKHRNVFEDQEQIMEASASTQNNVEQENGEIEPKAEISVETPNDQGEKAVKEENAQENEKAESVSTPQTKYEPWPGIPDLNKRFRMIVAAYQRIFRRAAARAQRMNKNRVQRQITERWTKREESDFYRAVSTFGTEMLPNGTFNWEKFRMVAKLDKKTDTSLTNYYIAFRAMCERTCRRTTIPDEDLPAVYVEQISEDRASRTLMRIQLLDRIRRECLIHPQLDARLKLCQKSPDLPIWWKAGSHDKELLVGLHKHGLSRGEIHILNDSELSFGEVMSSAQKIAPKIVVKSKEEPAEINEDNSVEKIEEKDENKEKPIEIEDSPKPSPPVDATKPSDEKVDEIKPDVSKKDETSEKAKPETEKAEKPKEQEVKSEDPEDLKEQDLDVKDEVKAGEAVPEGPVVEVTTEEEKQLLEAEFIQQQAMNRWPKDKIIMQRAEQVCFCILQGEWPTPKLLNSMMNLSAVGQHGASGSGAMDSPHRTESPASDYRSATKSAKMRGRPQARTPYQPQNSTLDAINSSQQLLQKLTELQQIGQVSKEEAEQLHHLLTQSIMLGLPVDALMSQLTQQPQIPPEAAKAPKVEKKPKMEQQNMNAAVGAAAKMTAEQQSKIMALEKQLQDPAIAMLLRQGMIDPAALGLDAETAKLIGLAPLVSNPKAAALDTKNLLSQPGMTPEVLQLMQMQGLPIPGMAGLGVPTPKKSAKKRPAPTTELGSAKDPDSRPASRASMASGSQRASTPNTEGKKRKSDDKVDVTTLGQNQIIPLIMGGVKMPEGIPNKDLKGLLDSNPSIKVDYEALDALLEKQKPKPKKQAPTPQPAATAAPAMPGADLAELGLTPEVMAQLMQQGVDPSKLNLGALGKSMAKPKANDPAHQRVQLINLSTYVKLDRKKCPELYNLESFLKKNPDYFVSTESKEFVIKHPKYFPRTMYQRIQPEIDPLAHLSALQDPKMLQTLMMQAQMDPKAMAVLQGLSAPQAAHGMHGMDQKMLASLGMDKNALAMAQLGGLDPNMLKALGYGGAGAANMMDQKFLASMGLDPKMLAALADPKMLQQQQQQQQQQQLAMLGLQGLDAKTMQALMGGIDPKQLGAAGMDPATLMALGLGGLGGGAADLANLQKQQQDQQLKAMQQLMGAGGLDQKQLAAMGLGSLAGAPLGNIGMSPQAPRSSTSTPKPSTPKPDERSTPKPADTASNAGESEKGEGKEKRLSSVSPVNGVDDDKKSVKSDKSKKDGSDGSKPSSPKPESTKSATPRPPSTPKSSQMDRAMQNTLKSLASVDPKALAAKGIDPSMLKQLGIIGDQRPAHSLAQGMPKTPGLEGMDMETLKAIANGDPQAMNRLLQQGQLGLGASAGLGGANPLAALGGLDPRMLGLDERTLMALSGGAAAANPLAGLDPKLAAAMGLDPNLMKALGMDANSLKALQQQELMKQQQQQMQMAMLGMGAGAMDPKVLQMLGGLDPATAQALMLQQQMGAAGSMDQAIMQQLLAGTMGQGKGKATPKKTSLQNSLLSSFPTSLPSSIPSSMSMELLKQQDLQLRALVSGQLQPDQLTPELSLLAAQLGLQVPSTSKRN